MFQLLSFDFGTVSMSHRETILIHNPRCPISAHIFLLFHRFWGCLLYTSLTDLGEITPTAAHYISKAHYLILEANYDEEMLKMGPYPQYLKERIASKTGHMSNSDTAEFLAENITEHLRYIWLCHLSKDNNHPELAYKTVEWKLKNKGVIVGKNVQLLALKRNTPSELYVFE